MKASKQVSLTRIPAKNMLLPLICLSSLALAQWPSFHGNSCNTGLYAGAQGRSGAWSSLWNFTTQSYVMSSPALADLDNDGLLEIVIGVNNDALYALNGENGSIVWEYSIPNSSISSSPLITDLDSDGKPEVVFASDDSLFAFQGESGDLIWAMPIENSGSMISPCTGDLDGDGTQEVVFTSPELKAFDGETGTVLWTSAETCVLNYGSLATGDIDLDGSDEVLSYAVISDIATLAAFDGADGVLLWDTPIPPTGYLNTTPTPAYADLDLDGYPEVILCSSASYSALSVLNAADGSVKWFKEFKNTEIYSSPCVADLDGDGFLEIVIGLYEAKKLRVYTCTGDLIWSTTLDNFPLATPAVADIDGDQVMEIIQPLVSGSLLIFNAETGVQEYSYSLGSPIASSPAIGDLNGDGYYDFVFGTHANKIMAMTAVPQGVDPQSDVYTLNLSVSPNPFKHSSSISYELSQSGFVAIEIFDLSGRVVSEIENSELSAGQHSVEWNGTDQSGESVSPGLYLCRIKHGDLTETAGVCLLR